MAEAGSNFRKSSYSLNNGNCVEVGGWRSSTRSSTGGACVETASDAGNILVRDTTNRDGGSLSFDAAAWSKFVRGITAA